MDSSQGGGQYHFDPATYLDMVRAEVPSYDQVQDNVAAASRSGCHRILDLGMGTGETAERVMERHPGADLMGIDESAGMLDVARRILPDAELVVRRLQDPLPPGPFDLVVSALAVHHLTGPEKADLFGRVRAVLGPSGRFVLGDLVLPQDPADQVTPIDWEFDLPSTADEQLTWLREAGFDAEIFWSRKDLAVLVADVPASDR